MPTMTENEIEQLLRGSDMVPEPQLDEAAAIRKARGGHLCSILVAQGYVDEDRLLAWLASQPGTTTIDISHYAIDPALRFFVPASFAADHEVMPVDKLKRNLTVAMSMPLDADTEDELAQLTELTIRAVLCSCSAIRGAIEQYYTGKDAPCPWPWQRREASSPDWQASLNPVRTAPASDAPVPGPEAVRLGSIATILSSVDRFPLLPEVHTTILDRLGDPEVSVADLTELIQQDATLTANVLKIANSAAYAARNRFTSVQRAVAYLGLRELHGVILSAAVVDRLTAQAECDLRETLRHSFRRGMLTKIVCAATGAGDRETAFTAGLLADLGPIAIQVFCPERAERIRAAAPLPGPEQAAVEESILGMTSSEVGYHLAQHWNIPYPLCEAIRYHDRLALAPGTPSPMTVAVALAGRCLAYEAEHGTFGDPAEDVTLAELLVRVGLEPSHLDEMHEQFLAGQELMAVFA